MRRTASSVPPRTQRAINFLLISGIVDRAERGDIKKKERERERGRERERERERRRG